MRFAVPGSLVLLATLIAPTPLTALQSSNQMEPTVPSPTAASLGKFGDVPISYFSGLPEISIPLFTAKGRTLDLPISLSYHASGIKVEEIGGWVGAGWALEAGGVITRTVRGIVDEQSEGYFNTGSTFYQPANWTFPPPVTLVQNIHDMQTIDGEPDQFFFNFAGQSGQFVGGDTSANAALPNVLVTIPYRKWKIAYSTGSDPFYGATIITQFVITTEDGTRFTFAAPEVHLDRSTEWIGLGGNDSRPYASAWYLTQIISAGGDTIALNYADYTAEHHTGMYREETNDRYEANAGDCGRPGYQVGSSFIYDLHNQTYVHAKRLTSIVSAQHTITFTHSLRQDALSPANTWWAPASQQQEPKLDLITVSTPAGVVLRKFEFEYTYGGSLGGRLTLQNVYEEDASGARLPPYSFTYDGPTLPARVYDRTNYHDSPTRTASFALDHWGYYNGATGNTTLIPPGTSGFATHNSYPGADREPNFAFMKAGSLIKITYPTGGFNEFVYEANDYSSGGSMVQGAPINLNASAISSSGDPAPMTTDFVINGLEPNVNAMVDIYIDGSCGVNQCIAEIWSGGSRLNGWTSSTPSGGVMMPLNWHTTYTLKAWNQGTLNRRVVITVHWTEQIVLTKKLGAGLRIAQVRADDGMGNVTVRKYSYQLSDGRSSGWVTLGPRYDYNRQAVSPDNSKQCSYYSRASAPRIPLGDGPIVEYSVVTESLGVNGVFGSTIRRFNANCDCANAAAAQNANRESPFLRYTTDGWRRGNPTSTDELNASGQIQQSTSYTYSTPPFSHPTLSFRGLAVDVYSYWGRTQLANTYYIYANQFLVQSALKAETAESTTLFDETGGNAIVASKQFTYGNPNHAQLTEISETNSDGSQRITRMRYPGDYTPQSGTPEVNALTAMQGAANVQNAVIERWVLERRAGVEKVLRGDVTTYREFLTGQFLPYQHFVLNSPSPLP